MESKQVILNAIRRHQLASAELPALDAAWIEYDDRRQQFTTVLESVGGRAVIVSDAAQLNSRLNEIEAYRDSKRICSLVAGVSRSNVELTSIDDPHELADIDFAILPGQFAVAENAAVWVTDEGLKHRALYFIAQHLALVVPASQILDNMHQAYQRLRFEASGFGVFISGPSKTADIEQSLVIGAHGARSLTVFLMEDAA